VDPCSVTTTYIAAQNAATWSEREVSVEAKLVHFGEVVFAPLRAGELLDISWMLN
jgi:hypothetical protein